ncbi:hypothetical protein Tco_1035838 [Tanacetum coccineum]
MILCIPQSVFQLRYSILEISSLGSAALALPRKEVISLLDDKPLVQRLRYAQSSQGSKVGYSREFILDGSDVMGVEIPVSDSDEYSDDELDDRGGDAMIY